MLAPKLVQLFNCKYFYFKEEITKKYQQVVEYIGSLSKKLRMTEVSTFRIINQKQNKS